MTPPPSPSDAITTRLRAFETELRDELADDTAIEREMIADKHITAVSIKSRRRDGLAAYWMEMGHDELIVQAGNIGGRWELDFALDYVEFIEDVTRSVIAGRAAEAFAWRRSRVEITLTDGLIAREVGGEGFLSLTLLPGWTPLGRHTRYAPAAEGRGQHSRRQPWPNYLTNPPAVKSPSVEH